MYRAALWLGAGVCCMLVVCGCMGGGSGTTRPVEQYHLISAVSPPAKLTVQPVPATLLLERFSANPLYNRTAMIVKPDALKVEEYQYNRWRLPPADMVTESLRHDLYASGIFSGVFGGTELQRSRYRISGRVEEFYEAEQPERQAVVALLVSLFDLERPTGQQLVFQNRYRAAVALNGQSPAGLAEAMSQAVQRCSRSLQQDVVTKVTTAKGL